jgi:hypothetical protein
MLVTVSPPHTDPVTTKSQMKSTEFEFPPYGSVFKSLCNILLLIYEYGIQQHFGAPC